MPELWRLPAFSRRGMLLAAAKRSQQLGWFSTVQSAKEQCGSYGRHTVRTLPSRLRASGDPPSLAREGVWTRSGIPLLRLALIIVSSQYPYKCLNCGGSPPFQGGDAVGCCEAQSTAGVVRDSTEAISLWNRLFVISQVVLLPPAYLLSKSLLLLALISAL